MKSVFLPIVHEVYFSNFSTPFEKLCLLSCITDGEYKLVWFHWKWFINSKTFKNAHAFELNNSNYRNLSY